MEDSRNIIKAIDALTLKAGGEVVDSKNITEAIDRLKEVYSQEAIGIDDTLTQEGFAADAKAVGDVITLLSERVTRVPADASGSTEFTVPNGYRGKLTTIDSTTNICGEWIIWATSNGAVGIRAVLDAPDITLVPNTNSLIITASSRRTPVIAFENIQYKVNKV